MAGITTQTIQVEVPYVTRVEGHGNIIVEVNNGILEKCHFEIIEAPRFIEAVVRMQPYDQVTHFVSRICGICSIAHTTASLIALENALDVKITPNTKLLRRLALNAEILDSHILHVYMLVAPDLFGMKSIVPLSRQYPEIITRALKMKKIVGDLCTAMVGRHTHPISMVIGGFTHVPSTLELSHFAEQLQKLRPELEATVDLFQSLKFPEFERDTEFIALSDGQSYCFMHGNITSSDGGTWLPEEYKSITNEYQVPHSTAKHARHKRESYMVGALARFNINYSFLHQKAKEAASVLNLKPKCINPYHINLAQVVEMVHCLEDSIAIVDKLLESNLDFEESISPVRAYGEGIGVVEAPRGTLYHHYILENETVIQANCIIPTAQNLANIERDMSKLVSENSLLPVEILTHQLEMLVRAYDPCISCATHMLEVKYA